MFERDFQLPAARLFCRVVGAGPPVLFIHGFPISGEMWYEAAAALADSFRCIVPDLRGHGRSEVSPRISMAEFADDLAGLLDALDERRPVALVGLSMGGMIALEFFRRHRPRVGALGLVCTRANAESPEGVERRRKMAEAALRQGVGSIVELMMPNLFGPGFPPERRKYWQARMSATPPAGAAAAALALGARQESFSLLGQIDVPTLVVAGARDAITSAESLREIADGIRGSRFVLFENCGHVPPVEFPAEFDALLREFLGAVW